MAVNMFSWINNIGGDDQPFKMLGLFQAGSTQAIKQGEILKLSGGNWVPLAADEAMAAIIAVAAEEVKAGDRAGYYSIYVPRPGDKWRYPLAAAAATAVGTAMYWSTSQQVKPSGNNVIGYAVGQDHYPLHQGHLADDASPDAGVTIKSYAYVTITFKLATSYYAALVL